VNKKNLPDITLPRKKDDSLLKAAFEELLKISFTLEAKK